MNESEALSEASEEIKRADHLIYVSLKYTRTVDVIINIIERFINAYNNMITVLLEKMKEDGKITEIPASILERVDSLKSFYSAEETIKKNMDFYILLRKLSKAEVERTKEYRRHVTMSAKLADGTIVEVNIDVIYEYFKTVKEFMEFVKKQVEE